MSASAAATPRGARGTCGLRRIPPSQLRILVIDDEPMCGTAMRRLLRRDHEVAVTTSATEALAWIRGGQRYDVILCDLCMPMMTGEDVFEAIAEQHPDQATRFALVTGSTPTVDSEFLASMTGRGHVLWKPFNQEALVSFLADVCTLPAPTSLDHPGR